MKKILLVSAMIIMLVGAMFVLTGCGEETTEPTTNTGNEGNNVIQLPVVLQNMYPDTTITELYMSGAGLDNWGTELLNGQQMPTGSQVSMTLNIDANNLQWDIKVVDQFGTEVVFKGLDLTNVSTSGATIVLQAQTDGTPVVTAQ